MKKILLASIVSLFLLSTSHGQSCVGSESLTASPPPNANGQYYPGTTVTFCYTVTDYAQTVADWLCGAVPTLGPAWDLTTLAPVSAPASCDGQGVWGWYPSCTATASGLTFGAGFYYDSPAGSPNGVLDGIPGNNFGDNCQTYVWTFCFSVMIATNAPNGADASCTMSAYSDYTCGSWGSDACFDPPNSSNSAPATVISCVLIVPLITVTNASCANTSDGSITASASGVPPYSYLWNTGATTATISNLLPGIYTVTVTDSSLCNKVTMINVGSPPAITLNETVTPDGCAPGGGSIILAPTGGSGSVLNFMWSDGSTGTSLTGLTAGTYTVTVTDSLNCTETQAFTINAAVPLSLTSTSTPTTCSSTNGTATAVITGGTPPFTYTWSPSGGNAATATNLAAGVYTVDVVDSAGCISSSQVTVQALGLFTLATTFVPLPCDPTATTTANVAVTGGTGPFTYLWTPMGGTSATGTGLTAGTYVVIVTDANSCVDSAIVTIPNIIPVSTTASSTPVQCGAPNSGTATVIPTGGSGTYSYIWSDGSTSATANNLGGGVYTVTVDDGQGCTSTISVTVTVIPDVFADAGPGQTICSGQPASLVGTGSGGTMPYTYSWDNGGVGPNIVVNPTVTTTYLLNVIDANNCSAVSPVIVTVIDYPVITLSSDANICFGGSTTLTASGGGSGSTYSWSPTAGLNDASSATPVANPTATTTYVVTVSNSLCASTASVIVTVEPEIMAAFTPDSTMGEAPLTVNFNNSTTGGLDYHWDFGDGVFSNQASPSHTYTQQGTYSVVMVSTNSLGCTDTARYSFIVVDEFASLVVPNIFTPNGDGFNDVFELKEKGIAAISVQIFNRWGKEVYSWSKLNGSWNGKSDGGEELPDGAYMYVIKATGINDKSYDYQGAVQMVRNK